MIQKKKLSIISTGIIAMLLSSVFLYSCTQNEVEDIIPGNKDTPDGKLVAFSISLQGSLDYNSSGDDTPATRSREPLISEWTNISSFNAAQGIEENADPDRIALMEIFKDSASATPHTRATRPTTLMPTGNYFRVLAFRRVNNDYKYECGADYIAQGMNAPKLVQGKMILHMGERYRFIGYSFNNQNPMGPIENNYAIYTTKIPIPNLDNDFMVFDAGDKEMINEQYVLSVTFQQMLAKLTIKITATAAWTNDSDDAPIEEFGNCTGVYLKNGGSSTVWLLNKGLLEEPDSNSKPFDIVDNGTATIRFVPWLKRPMSLHFGTITVGGIAVDNNVNLTTEKLVATAPGNKYTMTAKFKRIGIQIAAKDINLGGADCTDQVKQSLSKLTWANGNINSTSQSRTDKVYTWTNKQSDSGYFYQQLSIYNDDPWTQTPNNMDPCSLLNPKVYGTNWRTPLPEEFEKLIRCSDQIVYTAPPSEPEGLRGMYFMRNKNGRGLFLPLSGSRATAGCGTEAPGNRGEWVNYWTFSTGMALSINRDGRVSIVNTSGNYGNVVRCVKGESQDK